MTPSQRITATAVDIILTRAADVLDADEHCGLASEVRDVRSLVAGWAPSDVRGGEMPEPWPGMLVEDNAGFRFAVGRCFPPMDNMPNDPWAIRKTDGTACDWTPANIREVRSHDGRVLWRKE